MGEKTKQKKYEKMREVRKKRKKHVKNAFPCVWASDKKCKWKYFQKLLMSTLSNTYIICK